MALPVYSNLLYPWISVYADLNANPESRSIWGIQFNNGLSPFDNNNSQRFVFGPVTGINYLATRVSIGQLVAVDKGQAILVTQGGLNYYLADENTVFITENPSV